jgi:hypothetical protein
MSNIYTADAVSDWASLPGVKLPADLISALATLEVCRWVDLDRGTPVFTTEGIATADQAEKLITSVAGQLVLASRAGQNGPLTEAKNTVTDQAARAVVGLARGVLPDIVDAATPAFEEVAEEFADVVSGLPEKLTSDSVVKGGPAVVELFGRASALADRLGRYDAFVTSTGLIQGIFPKQYEGTALRILSPESIKELSELDAEHATASQKPEVVRRLNPVLLAGARLGVPFRLKTMRDAIAERKRLSTPAEPSFR